MELHDSTDTKLLMGSLPPWRAMDSDRVLTGIPTQEERFDIGFSVNDGRIERKGGIRIITARNTKPRPVGNLLWEYTTGQSVHINLGSSFIDDDGDQLTYEVQDLSDSIALDQNGVLRGDLPKGEFSFTLLVSDIYQTVSYEGKIIVRDTTSRGSEGSGSGGGGGSITFVWLSLFLVIAGRRIKILLKGRAERKTDEWF